MLAFLTLDFSELLILGLSNIIVNLANRGYFIGRVCVANRGYCFGRVCVSVFCVFTIVCHAIITLHGYIMT